MLGERCSGTSYLQRLLEENFDLSSTDDYHHRHFFGFEQVKHPYRHSECVLFLGVIREPMEWLECFYKCQWQLDQWRYLDWQSFLTLPIVSYAESEMNYTLSQLPVADRAAAHQAMLDKPIWHDRNFDDSQLRQWQDVFQLRRVKGVVHARCLPQQGGQLCDGATGDLSTHPQHFLHILQLWFNIRPKGRQTADYIEHLTAHSPLASYKEVDMDDDVSNDVDLRRDAAHDHASAEVRETVWQQLDNELEARVGYTVHGGEWRDKWLKRSSGRYRSELYVAALITRSEQIVAPATQPVFARLVHTFNKATDTFDHLYQVDKFAQLSGQHSYGDPRPRPPWPHLRCCSANGARWTLDCCATQPTRIWNAFGTCAMEMQCVNS